MTLFVETVPEKIETIQRALECENLPEIKKSAHSLISITGQFRLKVMEGKFRTIEELAGKSLNTELVILISEVEKEIIEVISTFEKYLSVT